MSIAGVKRNRALPQPMRLEAAGARAVQRLVTSHLPGDVPVVASSVPRDAEQATLKISFSCLEWLREGIDSPLHDGDRPPGGDERNGRDEAGGRHRGGYEDGARPLRQPCTLLDEVQDDHRHRCGERKHDEPSGEVTALGLCRLQRRAGRRERMRPRGLEHAERGGHAGDEPRDEESGAARVECRLHHRTAGQRDQRTAAEGEVERGEENRRARPRRARASRRGHGRRNRARAGSQAPSADRARSSSRSAPPAGSRSTGRTPRRRDRGRASCRARRARRGRHRQRHPRGGLPRPRESTGAVAQLPSPRRRGCRAPPRAPELRRRVTRARRVRPTPRTALGRRGTRAPAR